MRLRLLVPAIALIAAFSVTNARADYWTYIYLAYNGFMTFDAGKFAGKQAQAMVLGTVADPNSITGKSGGILNTDMTKLNLNYDEKEQLANLFTAIGDPEAMTSQYGADSTGKIIEVAALSDETLPEMLKAAEVLGMDPTQMQAMGAMNHHLAKTQAFDYAIREYEKMGGEPMTISERLAFNAEVQLLKNDELNHANLAKLATTAAKAAGDQKLLDAQKSGMDLINAQIILGGKPINTVNPEYYGDTRVIIPPSAGLYAYTPANLLKNQNAMQQAALGNIDSGFNPVASQDFASGNYPANGDLSETADGMIGTSTRGVPGTQNGQLGCAAAVSMMYKNSTGEDILPGRSMVIGTNELYSGLSNDSRFAKLPVSQAQPGDIIVTARGSRAGHTGIVTSGNRIISNSSGGFNGSSPGTIQNNYSLDSWNRTVTTRNPGQTAVFRRIQN